METKDDKKTDDPGTTPKPKGKSDRKQITFISTPICRPNHQAELKQYELDDIDAKFTVNIPHDYKQDPKQCFYTRHYREYNNNNNDNNNNRNTNNCNNRNVKFNTNHRRH